MAELNLNINARDNTTAQVRKINKEFDRMTRDLNNNNQKMVKSTNAFSESIKGLTSAFGALAVGGFIVSATKEFAQFEKELANVSILLNKDVEPTMKSFRKEIEQLSTSYGVSASQLSKSTFDIVSATGDAASAMNTLEAATQLAIAGGSEITETTSGLLTLMESYGDELRDVADGADLLFIAQKKARATIGELATASGRFLPVASQLGIKAEDIFASFSKVTVALGNVNESSTALTGLLNGLLKPTDELNKLMNEWFGMTTQQAVAEKGLVAVLAKLSTVESEQLGKLLPRIEGLRALFAITNDLNGVMSSSAELTERAGITQEALGLQMESAQKKIDQLVESFASLKRELGELVADSKIIDGLRLILEVDKSARDVRSKIIESAKGLFSGQRQDVQVGLGVNMPGEFFQNLEDPQVEMKRTLIDLMSQEITMRQELDIVKETNALNDEIRIKREKELADLLGATTMKYSQDQVKMAFLKVASDKAYTSQKIKGSKAVAESIIELGKVSADQTKQGATILKGVRTAEAIMNTHTAVSRAYAEHPFPFNLVVSALMLAKGLAEVSAIQSTKFAEGTDRVPAVLSPGEMVIPSRFADAIRRGDLYLGGRSRDQSMPTKKEINLYITNNIEGSFDRTNIDELVDQIGQRVSGELLFSRGI